MGKFLRALALLGATTVMWTSSAEPAKEAAVAELDFIQRIFEIGYAPTLWKKQHINWDLKAEHQKALAALASKTALTPLDYRKVMSDFLRSTQDYHVGVYFDSTESATLPFLVNSANGKYFVVYVDESKVSKETFPFQVGDELVLWGNLPPQKEIDSFKESLSWGVAGTDQRISERMLTQRYAAMNMIVPQGQVELTFKRTAADGTETLIKRQMSWEYNPERVTWNLGTNPLVTPLAAHKSPKFSKPQMTWGFWKASHEDGDEDSKDDKKDEAKEKKEDPSEKNRFIIGGRKSFVPTLGTVLWEAAATEKFHAYMYKNETGKVIGYVRIPHFGESTETFVEFKKVIERFKDTTDALVIDEINNPGGSVFYVLALMSVLSNEPVKVPDHHIAIWPGQIKEAFEIQKALETVKNDSDAQKFFGKALDGFPVTFQFARTCYDYTVALIESWKNGERLTKKALHLYGVDKVNPDPEVNYTKPILVLVNELDFSGGDFFPAILQDNKRAKIFGQRTSGAGGYVLQVAFPSSLGLNSFSFTGSLARRINNEPIENLGVTPDISYQLSEKDYRQGFVEYKAAINKAVDDLIPSALKK